MQEASRLVVVCGMDNPAPYVLTYHQHVCLLLARQSPDLKLKYGAILTAGPDELLVGQGFNHPPDGYSCADCPRVRDRSIKSGTQLEKCFAVHAEQAALWDAALYRVLGQLPRPLTIHILGLNAETLDPIFLTEPGFYCSLCARDMAEAGIDYVVVSTFSGPVRMPIADVLDSAFTQAACFDEPLPIGGAVR